MRSKKDQSSMTSDATEHSKLANTFASFCSAEPEIVKKTYEKLNQAALEKAKLVSTRCGALNAAWAEFLPTLNEMQSFLSQRGVDREKPLAAVVPSWSEWLTAFIDETGLNVCVRAVQKRLAKFRNIGRVKSQRPSRTLKFSGGDQAMVELTSNQVGEKPFEAVDSAVTADEAAYAYMQAATGSESIKGVPEASSTHREAKALSSTPNVAVAITPVPVPNAKAVPQEPLPAPRRLIMPGPGDWSALFNSVNDSCGPKIKAVLEGLRPEAKAEVFGNFVRKLAKTYCHLENPAIKIQVTVEVVNRNSSMGKAA